MRCLTACLLTLVLLAPGCASGRNYAVNRVSDLADILRLHVMAGPGVGAKLEATRLLHAGILYERDVYAAGIHDRAIGTWKEDIFTWGLLVGHHSEETTGIPRLTGDYGWNFEDEDQGGMFRVGEDGTRQGLDLLTFRGSAMILIGLDIEVRVGEVLDFVAGIFQFDPSADDIDMREMREPNLDSDRGRSRDTGREPDLGDDDYDYTIK